jgi:hypothetical protein
MVTSEKLAAVIFEVVGRCCGFFHDGFLHGFTTTEPTFLKTKPCFWHVSVYTGPPGGLLVRHFKEFSAPSVLLVGEKLLFIHSLSSPSMQNFRPNILTRINLSGS